MGPSHLVFFMIFESRTGFLEVVVTSCDTVDSDDVYTVLPLKIAVTYDQEELRERCLDFIEENTESVFRTKGFNELSEEALSILLQSDKLMMDELEILVAVREWATVNSVRFGLLVDLYNVFGHRVLSFRGCSHLMLVH